MYNFNEQPINVGENPPDVQIDVALRYPHGTLIVDDPVNISGVAIQYGSLDQHIQSLTIWFQNALSYPITQDENGMTEGIDLLMNVSQGNNKLIGSITAVWVLEGTYNPELSIVFTNETSTYAKYVGVSPSVAITVYPKAELAQIITNNVSMILTIAFYILTVVGTSSLVLSLWDREPSTQDEKKNTHDRDRPTNIDNEASNTRKSVESEKNPKGIDKHTSKQNR